MSAGDAQRLSAGTSSGGASLPCVNIPTGQTAAQIPSRRHFFSSATKRHMLSSPANDVLLSRRRVYTRTATRHDKQAATTRNWRAPIDSRSPGADNPRDSCKRTGTITPSRSTRLLFSTLLAALLLLRSPGSLLHPQFWAEDGTLFFQEAFNHGFLGTILQPASGYLHRSPDSWPVFRCSSRWTAPLIFNLAAFVVQLIPAFYLLSPRMARLIPSFPARAPPRCCTSRSGILRDLRQPHQLPLAPHLDGGLHPGGDAGHEAANPGFRDVPGVSFSLTGPFSILFLPLVAPRLLGVIKGVHPFRSQMVSAVIAAAVLIQLGLPQPARGSAPPLPSPARSLFRN